ncbi:MAG: hypothetical protein ACPGGA_05325, partial [Balneolaceae bacterium]
IAWAFELTPEGIKKSDEVEITESVTKYTGKKLNKVIISVLSIALIFLLTERIFFAESRILEQNEVDFETASIAVLPFVNMSDDQNNEFFSDGLSEELLNVLAKVDELKVAGRTSSFKFKGQNENLSLIGEELNVNHILEGSVRKAGDRIRITAQLINVEDGFHMWSETYDRELTTENIFDIQDEISNTVLAELKVRLLGDEEITTIEYTQDIEAYNLYLAGTQLEKNRIVEELEAAAENYKTAIRLDPGFALAYARLAWVYYLLHEYGNLPLEELLVLMKENVDTALSIDPNLGKAVLAEAVYYRYADEPENGLEASDRAIELIPNDPETWIVRRNALFFSSRSEGIPDFVAMGEATRRAYELDNNNPAYANMYARVLPDRGEHEEAIEILERINRLYPDFAPAYGSLAYIYSTPPYSDLDKAFLVVFEQYQQNDTDLNILVELLEASMSIDFKGMEDFVFNRLQSLYPYHHNAIVTVTFYMMKNREYQKAVSFLEEAEANDGLVPNWLSDFAGLFSAIERKDYGQAIDHFIRLNPEVESTNIDEVNVIDYVNFITLKELAGDTSVMSDNAQTICDRVASEMETVDSEVRKLELESVCHFVKKDYEGLYETKEALYFDLLEKDNFVFNYSLDVSLQEIVTKYPPLLELANRILADIHSMRDDVIEELKQDGSWNSEWELTE